MFHRVEPSRSDFNRFTLDEIILQGKFMELSLARQVDVLPAIIEKLKTAPPFLDDKNLLKLFSGKYYDSGYSDRVPSVEDIKKDIAIALNKYFSEMQITCRYEPYNDTKCRVSQGAIAFSALQGIDAFTIIYAGHAPTFAEKVRQLSMNPTQEMAGANLPTYSFDMSRAVDHVTEALRFLSSITNKPRHYLFCLSDGKIYTETGAPLECSASERASLDHALKNRWQERETEFSKNSGIYEASLSFSELHALQLIERVYPLERQARSDDLIVGYRGIRGDKNCYYRSVFLGYLEVVLLSGDPQKKESVFSALIQQIAALPKHCGGVLLDGQKLAQVVEILKQAKDDGRWNRLSAFYIDMLGDVGLLFIYSLRCFLAKYIQETATQPMNPSDNDSLSFETYCSITNQLTVDAYIERNILTMGVDMEGPVAELGIFVYLLPSCRLKMFFLDRREGVTIRVTQASVPHYEFSVYLLLKPGHYELVYTKFDVQRIREALFSQQAHLLYDINPRHDYVTVFESKDVGVSPQDSLEGKLQYKTELQVLIDHYQKPRNFISNVKPNENLKRHKKAAVLEVVRDVIESIAIEKVEKVFTETLTVYDLTIDDFFDYGKAQAATMMSGGLKNILAPNYSFQEPKSILPSMSFSFQKK